MKYVFVTDDEDDFLYSEEALDIVVEAMRVLVTSVVVVVVSSMYIPVLDGLIDGFAPNDP